MARALRTHHRQGRARQIDDVEQVGLDLVAKIGRRHLLERRGMAIAGVVDQHVKAAEGAARKLDRPRGGGLVGHVELDRQQTIAMSALQIREPRGIARPSPRAAPVTNQTFDMPDSFQLNE